MIAREERRRLGEQESKIPYHWTVANIAHWELQRQSFEKRNGEIYRLSQEGLTATQIIKVMNLAIGRQRISTIVKDFARHQRWWARQRQCLKS